jgi:hypothetical protein
MYTVLIILAGIGTAYVVNRMTPRQSFQLADLLIGVVSGLIGLSVGYYFGLAGPSWSIGLPLLVACGLTLGLSSSRTAHV